MSYIGRLPGEINNGGSEYTDLLTVLGISGLTPFDMQGFNDGKGSIPMATIQIGANEYLLKDVLTVFKNALIAIDDVTGVGIYSGLEVAAQTVPAMTFKVSAGVRYKADGTRQAVLAVASKAVNAADTVKDRIDLVYLDADGVVTYLPGTIEIDAVAGARSYTVGTNAVVGDTIVIGGQTFTAVTADPGTDEFVPGETAALTATALYNLINLNAVLSAIYTATNPSAGVVLLTETVAGGLNTPPAATKTGTVVITSGTPTASVAHVDGGTVPATPTGGAALAELDVNANQTTIVTGSIAKKRVWTLPGVND